MASSAWFEAQTVSDDYLPGLPATMYLPTETGPTDLVVLVPGGGWSSADPTGLIPLSEQLAGGGATSVTVTYSTTAFNNKSVKGTWTLEVDGLAGGTLNSWSMSVREPLS